MESPEIKDLLIVETDRLAITIKGKKGEAETEESQLKVSCTDSFSCYIDGVPSPKYESSIVNAYNIIPLFYEQNKYEFIVEYNSDCEIEFYHDNPQIRDAIKKTGRKSSLLSGVINFENEIGFSDFVIRINGQDYLTITLEVFPSKISYKEDYKEIMNDVTSEIYNLAFDFMKKTYSTLDISNHKNPSDAEFFAIMDVIYGRFIKVADLLISKPHHVLQTSHEVMPSYKVKRYDNKTIKWLNSHTDCIQKKDNGLLVSKALGVKKCISYDTNENRFTKFILFSTIKKLESVLKKYKDLQRKTDHVVVDRINRMIRGIQARYRSSFLSDVRSMPSRTSMSLVFSMAPGYRELYRCYLLMQHGLSITDDLYKLSLKNVAELYEYWCFIKLNSLVKDLGFMQKSKGVFETNKSGLFVTLVKGKSSHIDYEDQNKTMKLTLSYNPQYNNQSGKAYPTVIEKPDNVLCLHKSTDDFNYEYVFDAKYRIDESDAYKKDYDGIGPKVDDINTMHRYRDSIVYKNNALPFERIMFGAYVLFPYGGQQDEYIEHRFYKSIEEVNIGGLPFLPNKTDLVKKQLESIIKATPEDIIKRVPKGVDYRFNISGHDAGILFEKQGKQVLDD